MYRQTKPVDWCQCCQQGVTFPYFQSSSDFLWDYNPPQIVHSSDNTCCLHSISFSFSAADKAPLCKGGWQKSLISDWGIVLYRYLTIPPSALARSHLPLHKGGFGACNNFTNYAVSICKPAEIVPCKAKNAFALWTAPICADRGVFICWTTGILLRALLLW